MIDTLEDIMHLVVLAVWGASCLITALHFVHMLQLSSYQTPGYLRWFQQHGGESYKRLAWIFPTLFFWLGWGAWALYVTAALYAFSGFMARPPRHAKKPLKFTSRVVRLLVTLSVMVALLGWGISFLGTGDHRLFMLTLGLFYLLSPFLVLVANIINGPLQRRIEAGYTRDAKKRLATHPGLIVLGITGSYGKTSTKHFLQRLLSEKYNTLMTPGSYNTPMGVVRTIREHLLPTHEVFVCEMGARHVGDIKELCDIVRPRYGVLTSVGPQHLETFGTVERVAATKFELIDSLPEDGVAFLNMSDENIRARPVAGHAVRYGLSETKDEPLDYRAFEIQAGPDGLTFCVETPGGETRRFATSLIGRHNVENITAAIAVAHRLGVPMPRLVSAVRALEPVPHRLRLLPPAAGLSIIDDAFNANPEGARVALEALSGFDGMKILVTPGFVELGEQQEACHEAMGRQAAAVCDFVALVGERQTASIARGLGLAGFPPDKLFVGETLQQAMAAVRALDGEGREKYVLLENDLPDNY